VICIRYKEAAFALAFGLSKESYNNVLTSEGDTFRIKSPKYFSARCRKIRRLGEFI